MSVLAAGVYAVRSLVVPQVHEWYVAWTDKARARQKAAEQQAEALQQAAEALKACQVRRSDL